MYKIIIKGEASTDYEDKSYLNGIDCQDEFSEYFGREFTVGDKVYKNEQVLIDKGVHSGYMRFEFDKERNKLFTITEYQSRELLTEEDLDMLAEYTQGQWSDGIGEGFEQNSCSESPSGEEIYISPWFHGQILEKFQTQI